MTQFPPRLYEIENHGLVGIITREPRGKIDNTYLSLQEHEHLLAVAVLKTRIEFLSTLRPIAMACSIHGHLELRMSGLTAELKHLEEKE